VKEDPEDQATLILVGCVAHTCCEGPESRLDCEESAEVTWRKFWGGLDCRIEKRRFLLPEQR
jgi:hypothetical protein